MKIAVIILEFPALNETFILDHITGLLDRGHDVHIYATAPKGEPKIHEDVKKYNLLDRTVYRDDRRFTIPRSRLLRLLKAVPLLAEGLLKNPRAVLNSLNVFRLGRAASSLSALYKAAPFFKFRDYDIVHCHFPENGDLAVFLRDVGAIKGKIVTTFHSYHTPYFKKGPCRLFPGLFKKGDLFLTSGEHSKRWFDSVGWGGDKMIVHRLAVPSRLFPAARPRPKDNGEVRLLSVGRLVDKKGIKYGIMGVAKIVRQFPNIRYEIAGDGPLRPGLERLIEELGAASHIRLLGWKDREEVLQLLRETDIFLAPCITSDDGDQETGPVVILEAMASGLPVVSTRHTGIPEFVRDGESGFLVGERDPEGIADKVAYLLKNPDLWHAIGERGRSYVEQHHDLDKQTDRLIEIYRSLLEEGSPFPKVRPETLFNSRLPGKANG
jgi:colanic acid/amylovoran biosynthesis glycosyltransferase